MDWSSFSPLTLILSIVAPLVTWETIKYFLNYRSNKLREVSSAKIQDIEAREKELKLNEKIRKQNEDHLKEMYELQKSDRNMLVELQKEVRELRNEVRNLKDQNEILYAKNGRLYEDLNLSTAEQNGLELKIENIKSMICDDCRKKLKAEGL